MVEIVVFPNGTHILSIEQTFMLQQRVWNCIECAGDEYEKVFEQRRAIEIRLQVMQREISAARLADKWWWEQEY
jgi:hypothetical protein